MSHTALRPGPLLRTAATFSARSLPLLMLAAMLCAAALVSPDPHLGAALYAAAGTLAILVPVLRGFAAWRGRVRAGPGELARSFSDDDIAPSFACDGDGLVLYRNAAARRRFASDDSQTLIRALGELFANPTAVIYRLQARAEAQGATQEDVVTRRGHVRVSVHRFAGHAFFWRFDELEDRGGGRGAEALSLPMMTVGRRDTILFMNEAARKVLGGRVKSLQDVVGADPIRSGAVAALQGPDGAVRARLVAYDARTGRREVYFLPLGADVETGAIDADFFDALPVALMKLAPDGAVEMANRLARDLLGAPNGAMNLCERVEGLGRSVRDWLAEVADGRKTGRSEVLRVSRDDQEVFLQISLERVVEDGETALVAVLHDATELKTLEAQFVQSQKMQAIGQLAGGVAHDFNNLLTAISGHCDLLMLRRDHGDPDYGDLVQIHQNANRAASLVGQLLAFSRKQTLRPEVVDLGDALTDLTHLLNRLVGETVSLTVSHDPTLAPVRADKRQLEQVIMNLVVNARDALPAGGEIRIETAMHHLTDELRRDRAVVPPGLYALVRVVDEGQGIPADKLDKIFEPFFTTKRTGEGTGLGLSTAYGIVKQSGGYIFVDSVIGSGTCFTLYFPVSAEPAQLPPPTDDVPQDLAPLLLEAPLLPAPEGQADGVAATAPGQADGVDTGLGADLQRVIADVAEQPAPDDMTPDDPGDPAPSDINSPVPGPEPEAADPRDDGAPAVPGSGDRPTDPRPGGIESDVSPKAGPLPSADPPVQGDGVVLLVEDEAPVRAFASRALRMRGYTVLEAGNAEEALQTLEDSGLSVDVFVTDVVMPGMDGPSWVRQALKARPEARVVFVSGYAEETFAETQADIPNSVFLPKPFSLTELTATVRDQLQ